MYFTSPHSKAECIKRFRAAVDQPWKFYGSKPVLGWTSANALHARKRIGYRNSFQTHMRAELRPYGGGMHVSLSFGMSPVAVVFMAIWFGFAGLAALAGAFLGNGAPFWGWAIPIGMMAFGAALVWIGRWFARDEAAFLTAFLAETLDLTSQDDG